MNINLKKKSEYTTINFYFKKMVNSNISLSMLDWTNENKHEAFSEWVDFMSSYFVIHNVEEK